jgi:hypothetical protein
MQPMKFRNITKGAIVPLLGLVAGLLAPLGVTPAQAETRIGVGVSIGGPLPRDHYEVRVGRDHYYYHRGVFYRPGRRGYYVVSAPRGAYIRELPPRYVRVYTRAGVYYRYGDTYYQPSRGGYIVVDAPPQVVTRPIGSDAPPPPPPPNDGYQEIRVGDVEYSFNDGQFFRRTPDGLEWTPAPLGAVIRALPADARTIWYQDQEFFECEEVYFRRTPEGYRVVEAPWRADESKPIGRQP